MAQVEARTEQGANGSCRVTSGARRDPFKAQGETPLPRRPAGTLLRTRAPGSPCKARPGRDTGRRQRCSTARDLPGPAGRRPRPRAPHAWRRRGAARDSGTVVPARSRRKARRDTEGPGALRAPQSDSPHRTLCSGGTVKKPSLRIHFKRICSGAASGSPMPSAVPPPARAGADGRPRRRRGVHFRGFAAAATVT